MKSIFKPTVILLLLIYWAGNLMSQTSSIFFPSFQPYINNPIIKYGDVFLDAAWNDPTVLKENGQYIMYITAANGISGNDVVKVYRQVSTDGYNWMLSPTTPVIEPSIGTYYEGGTETPSVVFKDGIYHMYLTCYPPGNAPQDFVIAHATSVNGINWVMDTTPVLESDGSATIYGSLVGEPGSMVYHDSIYVFFTSAGIVGSNSIQCIGLIKSADGTNFGAAQQVVTLPQDIYALSNGYWGLSTPSALAINDSIYLFTDVAQTINGTWTQVALHQFKTDGTSGIWHHDVKPIHTMQDFNWTNGTFYSEIRSITPLMDDNGLLRIWYAGNRLADVSGTDTTYHVTVDGLGNIHVDPNYWGIGTSEYQFPIVSSVSQSSSITKKAIIYPNPTTGIIFLSYNFNITITDVTGKIILIKTNSNFIDISNQDEGMYFIILTNDKGQLMQHSKLLKV